ncbi:protein-glutamate O-methyltransferase CheR [Sediminibacterium roseum]|uniref:Protein-glutamate O-methyltransferase CheR n=1 Tax=Sediminibacterium roseum TaxID=1978412 RepID=A0ABX0A032_9BACT|nr:protein-glutamate O-methyltransferase CheR [Sediminibacterium roseum]NCI50511.1 protein-glutamate O-methyltransferase CheR [Sediminibacterium roseum]
MYEKSLQIQDDEMEQLLADVLDRYGYDFTDYSRASLKRRINRLLSIDRFPSYAEFRYKLQNDSHYLHRFVEEVTVNVTEMFRDPSFYKALRTDVLPMLATYPFIRIWHAGCSTGEEVYSMAILLHEANLLHKSLIYATDVNPGVLEKLRKGIFPLANMKQYAENYIKSGGTRDFSQYYMAKYNLAKFDQSLATKMIISTHNLTSDSSFNEFQLICCRNVLIYFEKNLQDRVLTLFTDSLEKRGFLALGSKESLKFSAVSALYKPVNNEKIWQKTN